MSNSKVARPGSKGRGKPRPKPKGPSARLIGILVAAVVVVVAAGIFFISRQAPQRPELVQGLPQDMATKGSPDAKVTITEYSDFQ